MRYESRSEDLRWQRGVEQGMVYTVRNAMLAFAADVSELVREVASYAITSTIPQHY